MEKRSTYKIIGVLMATAGAMIVTWFSGGGTEGKSIQLGSLFFLINCVSSSLFVVRSPRVFLTWIDRFEGASAAISRSLEDVAVVQRVLRAGDDRGLGDVWK